MTEIRADMSDLRLAHVGQRLFEMLRRSCGMARGQLAGISKHKSDSEEHHTTIEEEGAHPQKRQPNQRDLFISPQRAALKC